MGWLKLTITCRLPCLDGLKDLLEKFGAESLSFSPASPEPLFADGSTSDQFWELTSVSALFAHDIDPDILLACVRNRLGDENIEGCEIDSVVDREWTESFKSGFIPIVFGDRLCICPSWCVRPDNVPHVIELDPGLAFGTGTHSTTALCLDWLATTDLTGIRVMDYGCGSGVLALAAAAVGAVAVTGVDIDPQALEATKRNARRNGLEDRIRAVTPGQLEDRKVDILMANILLKPLLELGPVFASLLDESGKLVLSGLLATQVEECRAVYRQWFEFYDPVYREEWAMLYGIRTPAG
jgi:ribosomal protein L11 methyltransferase